MSNIFDSFKSSTFDVVARTMGYDCLWGELSARVLLQEPTESEQRVGISYNPRMTMIEWKQGDLPGLFEAVREHTEESVTIGGKTYVVRNVLAIFDGETYRAEIIEDTDA